MLNCIPETTRTPEGEFPANGTPEEKLRFVLPYVLLAPSSHNTQPWRFKLQGEQITFYADRTRVLPYIDPQHRELILSCGTALFHLRTAIRRFGYAGQIDLLPDPTDPDLLARIGLGEPTPPTAADLLLFESIFLRHTNREPFCAATIPPAIIEALEAAASREGAWLRIVPEGVPRDTLIELIAQADAEQLADPRFRRDTATWLRANDDRRGDGVPKAAFGMPGLIRYAGPFLVRTFDTSAHYASRERQLATHSPLLVVLGTPEDTPRDWLQAGQALSHVLLLATEAGISASFLNSPVEVEDLRPKVRDLVGGTGFPQLVLRLGYGPEARSVPRRPLPEVISEETDRE